MWDGLTNRQGEIMSESMKPASPDDAEALRQKLTELIPLVSWRVDVLTGEFWIVGNVVVSRNLINVGYRMMVSEYYHIRNYDQWHTWRHILSDVLAKGIMEWRPNAAGDGA